MTEADDKMSKGLRNPKTFYLVFLAAVVVLAIILYVVAPLSGSEPLLPISDSMLTILTVVISIISAYMIVYGFFILPRRILKIAIKANRKIANTLYTITFLRSGSFTSVAIFGLILGIIGAGLPITIPYFAVSFGALIITFPTEKRWQNMLKSVNIETKAD
jgi:hypothetical protein